VARRRELGWTGYTPLSVYDRSAASTCGSSVCSPRDSSTAAAAITLPRDNLAAPLAPKNGITFKNLSPVRLVESSSRKGSFLLATPVLAGGLFILLLDRHGITAFLSPAVGGDPIMWQHLFWLLPSGGIHMILPAMGYLGGIPRMSHKADLRYKAIALSTVAIGFLSFGVWVHHMFTTGISIRAPSLHGHHPGNRRAERIKIFTGSRRCGAGDRTSRRRCSSPIGFVTMFVIGGINGVFQAPIPLDYPLQDTYWVVAPLHYVLFGGTILGVLRGFYFWFPRMSRRMYSERSPAGISPSR